MTRSVYLQAPQLSSFVESRPLADQGSNRQVIKLGLLPSTLFTSPTAFCFVLCVLAAPRLYFHSISILLEDGRFYELMEVLQFDWVLDREWYVHQITSVSVYYLQIFACPYELSYQGYRGKRKNSSIFETVARGPPVVHRYVEYLSDRQMKDASKGTWSKFLPCCC